MKKLLTALLFSSLLTVLLSGVFNDVSATEINRNIEDNFNDDYVVQPYAIEVRVVDTFTQNRYNSGWGKLENYRYITYYVRSGIEDLGWHVQSIKQHNNYQTYTYKHTYKLY